jgi:DNA adenine methylase
MRPTMPEPTNSDPRSGSFYTPLRYPGGKGRLGPWLAELMRFNRISGGWYVEAYAGGAGAALFLLMRGYVDHIVINDADPVVHSFWSAITRHPADFLRKMKSTPVTIESWEVQREVLARHDQYDVIDVGFAAFFLNRTNRSGILAAGAIGGKSQTGPWRLDARYNVADLSARIEHIGRMAKNITVLGMDALDLLTDAAPGFPEKCLVYLDPPYYVKGSQLYRNHYLPEDHAAIAHCVMQAEYPVVVTYDDCPEIQALYAPMRSASFSLHYSTHLSRPKANEALFYRNLILPGEPKMTRGRHLQQARTKGATLSQSVLTN